MANVIRRYSRNTLDQTNLQKFGQIGASVIAATPTHVDIQVDNALDGYAANINNYMSLQNCDFLQEGPTSALLNFFGAVSMVVDEVAVSAIAPAMQLISGVVTNVSFFTPDLGLSFGLLNCVINTDGPCEIDLIEDNFIDPPESKFSVFPVLPDTSSVNELYSVQTDVPFRSGRFEYTFYARKQAGTSIFNMRSGVVSLLSLATP